MKNKDNVVANVFKLLAWCTFIGGVIAGFAFGTVEERIGYNSSLTTTELSFIRAAIYWISSFIAGMLFYGFGEIIQLLSNISNTQAQQTQQLCTAIEALASTPDGETETPPQD